MLMIVGVFALIAAAEPAGCERAEDCETGDVCAGYRELEPGQFSRGVCVPGPKKLREQAPPRVLSTCVTDADCTRPARCVDHRDLGDGTWSYGVCVDRTAPRAPRTIDPRSVSGERTPLPIDGSIPPGFRLVTQPNWRALTPGIITTAVTYGIACVAGIVTGAPEFAVPLIGPALWASQFYASASSVLPILDLVGQGLGVSMIVFAILTPRRWLEPLPAMTVLPSTNGVSLRGVF
jgi:hypothetical protein